MEFLDKELTIKGKKTNVKLVVIKDKDRALIRKLFDLWKGLNDGIKKISTRGINIPEAVSESAFCLFFNSARVIKISEGSGSFDTINLKTMEREQIKASSIEYDLTSFGPKSVWDKLYFLDFSRMDGSFDVFLVPNKLIYSQIINKKKNETFLEQQKQGRRPRFSIKRNILIPNKIKPIKKCKL